jgi:hypothetical protein
MLSKLHLQPNAPHPTALRTWQRLAVGAALVVGMLLSGALIVYRPGERTFATPGVTLQTPAYEHPTVLPAGTEVYYFGGQWKPLDQQP